MASEYFITLLISVYWCVFCAEMPLRGCASLKTPPKEIVRRGLTAILGYLRRLLMGSVECKRTKLMMVGLGGAGKTRSFLRVTAECFARLCHRLSVRPSVCHTRDLYQNGGS